MDDVTYQPYFFYDFWRVGSPLGGRAWSVRPDPIREV